MKIPVYTNNGTYGCVFRPGVSCKGKILDESAVSKVFKLSKHDVTKEEYDIHNKIVNKIDPSGEFTLKLIETCKVEMKHFSPPQVKKCGNFTFDEMAQKYLPQIVYEYGGVNLFEATRKFSFEELFSAMTHVFKGINKMNQFKTVHVDIKPENMVYNHRTGKLALIDFGMASKYDNLYMKDKLFLMVHPYQYYPPEFPLIANHIIGKNYYNSQQNTYSLEEILKTLESKYRRTDLASELNTLIERYKNIRIDNLFIPDKIDIYMLGASILELVYLCNQHHTIQINTNIPFYKDVFNLIGMMIHPDPSKRFFSSQAVLEYERILKQIKKIPPPSPTPSTVRVHKSQESPIQKPKSKTKKVCPPGSILNPVTKRCNKIKANADPTKKICPPGSILNPVTKRCNKIKANADPTKKICPPGSILNPVTKRCNKIKV